VLTNVAVTRAKIELHILLPIDQKNWKHADAEPNPVRFIKKTGENFYQLQFLEVPQKSQSGG
jgi:superfamily I DNA/RNA helicase